MSNTGHAFIKERMREEDAIYGGEMSAHHYFRDFAYCDSGMIPWLLVASSSAAPASASRNWSAIGWSAFPASGEINRKLADPSAAIREIETRLRAAAVATDHTDGLSMEFPRWRFNLRCSNTEPVIRLNVEARADAGLMREKTEELLRMIDGRG